MQVNDEGSCDHLSYPKWFYVQISRWRKPGCECSHRCLNRPRWLSPPPPVNCPPLLRWTEDRGDESQQPQARQHKRPQEKSGPLQEGAGAQGWPELPPGILSRSYGFLVMPWRWLWDSNHMHSSLVLVVTSGMAPAFFSRVKGGASTEATTPLLERRPEVKGMPARRIQPWQLC